MNPGVIDPGHVVEAEVEGIEAETEVGIEVDEAEVIEASHVIDDEVEVEIEKSNEADEADHVTHDGTEDHVTDHPSRNRKNENHVTDQDEDHVTDRDEDHVTDPRSTGKVENRDPEVEKNEKVEDHQVQGITHHYQ